jgi:hypothetical protein
VEKMNGWLNAPDTLILHLEDEPQHPLKRRLGGFQSYSGCFRDREISCFCQELNHISLVVQLMA